MRKGWIFLVGCLISGCLGGYSPESNFYSLQSCESVNTKPLSGRKLSIKVKEVELPDYLEKSQIVSFDYGSPQMNIAETERWGEPLASMIRRSIAADIGIYLPKSVVKTRSVAFEQFDFFVDVEIVRFDMIEQKGAILEAWWYISDKNGKILKRRKAYFEKRTDGSYTAFAEMQSCLLSQLSREIAWEASRL